MSRRSESDDGAAIAAWNRLSLDEQHDAARKAAYYLTKRWPRSLSSNVKSFAFGVRRKRMPVRGKGGKKTARLLRDCPTLVVVVDRKLPRSKLSSASRLRPIPGHMIVPMELDRRVVKVAVPTDVISRPRQPKAQSITGLQMESLEDGLKINGSVAAIVRDEQETGERYFLTCHHVACLSLLDPDLHSRLPAEATLLPSRHVIGTTEREAFFGMNVGPCVDAALVRINLDAHGADLSLLTRMGGFVDSIAQLQSEAASGIFLFSLHKAAGQRVRFLRVHLNFDVQYESGASATMVEAMEYQVLGRQTKGGDSGGALVSGNGVFLGMHIAGFGSSGFGIPAYLLLESVAFDPPITLADPL